MAARSGLSVPRYLQARTYRLFELDVRAWINGMTYPLSMLLGRGGEEDGATSSRAATQPNRAGVPAWYRRKPGTRYTTHDLGPIKGQSTSGRGDVGDWNHAVRVLKHSWSGASSLRGGTGLSSTPVAARFGRDIARRHVDVTRT